MKLKSLNRVSPFILLLVLSLAILAGSYLRFLDNYELESLDFRFRARPHIKTTDKVVLIEIGDDTIKKIGRFPFDRTYHAILVKALSEAGAHSIVFDAFFSEPQKGDSEFEEAIRTAGNVYLPIAFELSGEKHLDIPEAISCAAKEMKDLVAASKGVGHINVIPDIDGKFRKVPAFVRYEGELYPALSLLVASDYLGVAESDIKIPVDANSNIIVNFSGRWGKCYKHYSYVDIIQSYLAKVSGTEPSIDLSSLKGKVCIIGLTAIGTIDLHPNPFEPLYPAVGIHAEIFNSILNKNFITRASRPANLFILAILSLLMSVIIIKARPIKGLLVLFAAIMIFIAAAVALFNIYGIWIDMLYPALMMVALYLCCTLYKYITEWKKRLLMENELGIAKKIQDSFLPKEVPSLDGIELAATMITARQVGGDLYDFINFGEDKIGVMIGDVSGKGVPASLFMAMVSSAFKSFAMSAAKPEEVLLNLNRKIVRESSSNLFVTVFYSVFDIKDKVMSYGNGGHLPVLYLGKGKNAEFLDVDEGTPLGLMEGNYSGKEMKFHSGDIFVFYTDGITEAMNPKGEMYGKERLSAVIEKNRNLPSRALLAAIEKDIRKFEPQRTQHDDMTIIAVKTT